FGRVVTLQRTLDAAPHGAQHRVAAVPAVELAVRQNVVPAFAFVNFFAVLVGVNGVAFQPALLLAGPVLVIVRRYAQAVVVAHFAGAAVFRGNRQLRVFFFGKRGVVERPCARGHGAGRQGNFGLHLFDEQLIALVVGIAAGPTREHELLAQEVVAK